MVTWPRYSRRDNFGWTIHPTAKGLKKWIGSAVLGTRSTNFQPPTPTLSATMLGVTNRRTDRETEANKGKKVKVEHLLQRPFVGTAHRRGAHVHGAHQAASHIGLPALYLSSRSRYSFTDPERMEGWVNPSQGCKEQLAHGCYATACGQRDLNPDLAIVSPAR